MKKNMVSHQAFQFLCIFITLANLRSIRAVDYTVENRVGDSPGGVIFNNQIGADFTRTTMDSATNFIWQTFQQNTDADRKNVQSVSFVVDNIDTQNVVALTSGNQIRYSQSYIQQTNGDKTEFSGVLYHEMTHVWQWNGNGNGDPERGSIIEGVADFVRLKANYVKSDWAQPGGGKNWTDGYSVTARFLDYCDGLRNGFVAELNKKMRTTYSNNYFNDLLGKSANDLWIDYKAKYGNIP